MEIGVGPLRKLHRSIDKERQQSTDIESINSKNFSFATVTKI